jgi:glycolate oxidase iron-sulfur subunit
MDRLLTGARAAQSQRRPLGLATRLRLALLARPDPLNTFVAMYRAVYAALPAGVRRLPRPPARVPGPTVAGKATVALFVGCVANAYESPTRAALIRLLAASGATVAIPAGQNCCGTAAAHAGDADGAARLSKDNRQAFAGQATVLSLASGCQATLAESLAGVASVEDAVAFLDGGNERLRFRSAGGRRVAVHLPCTQRVLKSDAALRRLLARIPDLDVAELPDTGCCGAAGLHMLAEPERAARLRTPLLAALEASGATELLSANIGCRLHLGNGAKIPVRHPIEFLAEHLA